VAWAASQCQRRTCFYPAVRYDAAYFPEDLTFQETADRTTSRAATSCITLAGDRDMSRGRGIPYHLHSAGNRRRDARGVDWLAC
jgi:hypothetical protein